MGTGTQGSTGIGLSSGGCQGRPKTGSHLCQAPPWLCLEGSPAQRHGQRRTLFAHCPFRNPGKAGSRPSLASARLPINLQSRTACSSWCFLLCALEPTGRRQDSAQPCPAPSPCTSTFLGALFCKLSLMTVTVLVLKERKKGGPGTRKAEAGPTSLPHGTLVPRYPRRGTARFFWLLE